MEIVNYHNLKIEPIYGKHAEELFRVDLPYQWWVSAGTALGLYRDGDFIQGDTDIDIAAKGYEGVDKDTTEALKGFELCRTIYHEGKPMQLAFIKDGIILDIYFHWQEDNNFVNYGESGKTVIPSRIYNPIEIETKYGKLPFPNPPEEYFKIRYGDDWQTPQNKKPIFV